MRALAANLLQRTYRLTDPPFKRQPDQSHTLLSDSWLPWWRPATRLSVLLSSSGERRTETMDGGRERMRRNQNDVEHRACMEWYKHITWIFSAFVMSIYFLLPAVKKVGSQWFPARLWLADIRLHQSHSLASPDSAFHVLSVHLSAIKSHICNSNLSISRSSVRSLRSLACLCAWGAARSGPSVIPRRHQSRIVERREESCQPHYWTSWILMNVSWEPSRRSATHTHTPTHTQRVLQFFTLAKAQILKLGPCLSKLHNKKQNEIHKTQTSNPCTWWPMDCHSENRKTKFRNKLFSCFPLFILVIENGKRQKTADFLFFFDVPINGNWELK